MCNYLSNFIATGDPNGLDSTGKPMPYWVPSSINQPYRMEFGDLAQLQRAEPEPLLELIIEQYFKSKMNLWFSAYSQQVRCKEGTIRFLLNGSF